MKLVSTLIAVLLLMVAACRAETWPIAATNFSTGEVLYYGEQDLVEPAIGFNCTFKHSVEMTWFNLFGEVIEFWPPPFDPTLPFVTRMRFYQVPTLDYPNEFPSCP